MLYPLSMGACSRARFSVPSFLTGCFVTTVIYRWVSIANTIEKDYQSSIAQDYQLSVAHIDEPGINEVVQADSLLSWQSPHLRDATTNISTVSSKNVSASRSGPGLIQTNSLVGKGWMRPDTIFGHWHLAKTAGTTINGVLANRFERVCGNKGNSYGYHQYQISNQKNGYNKRENGFQNDLNKIGFDDCDFISLEVDTSYWKKFNDKKMEMHIPCRNMFDHFLSQANHRGSKFDCSALDSNNITEIRRQVRVDRILIFPNRFQAEKIKTFENAQFKCFDPMPPKRYIDYMANILQERRVVPEYVHRSTNKKRVKEKECLSSMDKEKLDLLSELLKEYWGLFNFCEECMGSENELNLPEVTVQESA